MKTIYPKSIIFRNSTETRKACSLPKCLQNLARVTADACCSLAGSWLAVHTICGLPTVCVMPMDCHAHFYYTIQFCNKFRAVVIALPFADRMLSKAGVVSLE